MLPTGLTPVKIVRLSSGPRFTVIESQFWGCSVRPLEKWGCSGGKKNVLWAWNPDPLVGNAWAKSMFPFCRNPQV
jgi:hypothetical protein